jgi:hypothetical protein
MPGKDNNHHNHQNNDDSNDYNDDYYEDFDDDARSNIPPTYDDNDNDDDNDGLTIGTRSRASNAADILTPLQLDHMKICLLNELADMKSSGLTFQSMKMLKISIAYVKARIVVGTELTENYYQLLPVTENQLSYGVKQLVKDGSIKRKKARGVPTWVINTKKKANNDNEANNANNDNEANNDNQANSEGGNDNEANNNNEANSDNEAEADYNAVKKSITKQRKLWRATLPFPMDDDEYEHLNSGIVFYDDANRVISKDEALQIVSGNIELLRHKRSKERVVKPVIQKSMKNFFTPIPKVAGEKRTGSSTAGNDKKKAAHATATGILAVPVRNKDAPVSGQDASSGDSDSDSSRDSDSEVEVIGKVMPATKKKTITRETATKHLKNFLKAFKDSQHYDTIKSMYEIVSVGPDACRIRCTSCPANRRGKYHDLRSAKETKSHHESTKHHNNYASKIQSRLSQQRVTSVLQDTGSSSTAVDRFCYELVELMLKNEIPMSRISGMAPFLETYCRVDGKNIKVPDQDYLKQRYIPLISDAEMKKAHDRIGSGPFGIIVDGSNKKGEWYVFVARYIDSKSGLPQQAICHVNVFKKTLSNKGTHDMANVIVSAITSKLKSGGAEKDTLDCCCFMRDRSSVNENAMREDNMLTMFPHAVDIPCSSHTITHAAEKVMQLCRKCDAFFKKLYGIFKNSDKARESFYDFSQKYISKFSSTRWMGKRDSMADVYDVIDLFCEWITDDSTKKEFKDSDEDSCYNYCLRVVDGPADELFDILMEFAVVLDATHFLKHAIYTLESNYSLAFSAYSIYTQIETFMEEAVDDGLYFSGSTSTDTDEDKEAGRVRKLLDDYLDNHVPLNSREERKEEIINSIKGKIRPMLTYYTNLFDKDSGGKLAASRQIFKNARICDPDFVRGKNLKVRQARKMLKNLLKLKVIRSKSDEKEDNPFARDTCPWRPDIDTLCKEWVNYRNVCSDINLGMFDGKEKAEEIEKFWARYHNMKNCTFKEWLKLAQLLMIMQPSSGGVERAFSILTRLIETKGGIQLDYLRAAMMLIFNKEYNPDNKGVSSTEALQMAAEILKEKEVFVINDD